MNNTYISRHYRLVTFWTCTLVCMCELKQKLLWMYALKRRKVLWRSFLKKHKMHFDMFLVLKLENFPILTYGMDLLFCFLKDPTKSVNFSFLFWVCTAYMDIYKLITILFTHRFSIIMFLAWVACLGNVWAYSHLGFKFQHKTSLEKLSNFKVSYTTTPTIKLLRANYKLWKLDHIRSSPIHKIKISMFNL